MVSVGIVKYDIVLSKKSIIPHFTLVASVASVPVADKNSDNTDMPYSYLLWFMPYELWR